MHKTVVAAALLSLGVCAFGGAQTSPPNTAPDNTKVNERDRQAGALTADQQEGKTDTETSRRVRQALVRAKVLSAYAHNVKIITQDGIVTLRGPVRTDEERNAIAMLAAQVAGEGKVRNELEISTPQKGK